MQWFASLFLALSVMGCGDDVDSRPLGDYCAGSDCPTLAETAGEIGWYVDEIQPCETLQIVIGERNVESGEARYFNDVGELVAAESYGWMPCYRVLYGPVPSCPDQQFWLDYC